MREVILINVTGKDKPGLTASLTGILTKYQVAILDIGQAVIHDYLSLGILVEIPAQFKSSSILKDLLFEAHKLDIQIQFSPIETERYEKWATRRGEERRIITLMGRRLTAEQLFKVAQVIAKNNLNIDVINRLSGRLPLNLTDANQIACVQIVVSGKINDPGVLRADLLKIHAATGIDISFYVDDIYRYARRLVVFDMDSTLIQGEAIDELADVAGIGEQISQITEAGMQGKIDFIESLTQRVALLKGLEENRLAFVSQNLVMTEGAERVVYKLKQLGYKIGIISGGFEYFGKYLQKRLGLDYVFANRLEIVDGKLTGNIIGDIINGQKKAEILRTIAQVENISLRQTIAVGDGANDLPMISIAGLGVAFNAKSIVEQNAQRSISSVGLDGLLYLMGLSEREIEQ
jgi:phosphoserine phosphatase